VLLLVTPAPSSPASTRLLDLLDVSATDAVKVVGAFAVLGAATYGGYRFVKWVLG
jgi:hypothetical protein